MGVCLCADAFNRRTTRQRLYRGVYQAMQRDQFVAPDFSQYPDYDDLERPVPQRRAPHAEKMTERPETPARPGPSARLHSAPWYGDRFMLVLLFIVAICLYNVLIVSRLEAEIAVLGRQRV